MSLYIYVVPYLFTWCFLSLVISVFGNLVISVCHYSVLSFVLAILVYLGVFISSGLYYEC